MALLILPGGTDVAEMALFATDVLPEKCPGGKELSNLEDAGVLIRFPTGADGGYLLFAYVDQPIPENVLRFCDLEDAIQGDIALPGGTLAFGGIESVWRNYKPNANIRSDASVPPGNYSVVSYRTEIPDEEFKSARNRALSKKERRFRAIPSFVFPICLLSFVIAGAIQQYFLAAAIVTVLAVWWRWFRRRPMYRFLLAKEKEVHLQFPSIVAELKPNPSFNTDWRDKAAPAG
jgi:hypothetical protein